MRKNIRTIKLILIVVTLFLSGCSSKPEVRHIPMTEYVEGVYAGMNGEALMINTGLETVKINLTRQVQQQIQEDPLENNTPIKVRCAIYDEGNGKSKRVAQEIKKLE